MTVQDTARSNGSVLEPLFSEFEVKSVGLRNRFVMAPMTRENSPRGVPSAENVDYYRQRAAGGVGMILTEGTLISAPAAGTSPDMPHMYGDASAEGWRNVVNAVHAEGAAIVSQLMHMGVMRGNDSAFEPDIKSVGPSGLGILDDRVGRPLTTADMDVVLQSYVESATLAKTLGFDGVELHSAHGMLLDNFLWSGTNQRTDGYGGTLENRVRFPAEVVAAVREAVGSDFLLSYRFSQWKVGKYEATVASTPSELERMLNPLAQAGIDMFHPSTRRHWQPAFPDADGADGRLAMAGWVKRVTGLPAIMVGSVALDHAFIGDEASDVQTQPDPTGLLLEQFENNEFDLLAVGRSLLADPEWVNKMRDNDMERIVRFERQGA